MIKIETKQYEVIETGSVIVPNEDFLEFEIEGLRFRFNFIDDKNISAEANNRSITGTLTNEGGSQYLAIDIRNYNSLFTTPSQMLEMGTIGDRTLSLMFSTVVIGTNENITRVFHYTWYKSKASCHGAE